MEIVLDKDMERSCGLKSLNGDSSKIIWKQNEVIILGDSPKRKRVVGN